MKFEVYRKGKKWFIFDRYSRVFYGPMTKTKAHLRCSELNQWRQRSEYTTT